jgi:hypothetical protein
MKFITYGFPLIGGGVILWIVILGVIQSGKTEKLKKEVLAENISSYGKIINIYSRSGGMGCINVTIDFSYQTENGQQLTATKDAVIDLLDTNKYQKGALVPVRYAKTAPEKVLLDIPNPALERMKRMKESKVKNNT